MATVRRGWSGVAGLPLCLLLIGLVVPPLVGMAASASSLASTRRAEADRARHAAEQVDVVAGLSQLEFVLLGDPTPHLAGIRELLGPAVDEEIAPLLARNRRAFAEAAETLVSNPDRLDHHAGTGAAERLDRLTRRIQATWREDRRDEALEREVLAEVRRLSSALRRTAEVQVVDVAVVLDRLSSLEQAMLGEIPHLLDGLLASRPPSVAVLESQAYAAEQRVLLHQLRLSLPPDLAERADAAFAEPTLDRVRRAILRDAGLVDDGPTRGELGLSAERIPEMAKRFYMVPEVRASLVARLTGQARSASDEAARQLRLTVVTAAAIGFLTTLFVAVAIRTTVQVLRTLTDRARAIGAGRIDEEPLGLTGRGDLARVAQAFDELTLLLRTLDRQLDALGGGRTHDPSLETPLPGRLGADMQRSVAHVTRATERLRASEARSTAVIDAAVDAILTVDADQVVRTANEATSAMGARARWDLVGSRLSDIFPELDGAWLAASTDLTNREMVLSRADGSTFSALVSCREVRGAAGEQLRTVFVRDISERKQLEVRLAHLAMHDHLTGLPNRAHLLEHLDRALAQQPAGRVAALFVDLDRFKLINDGLGHDAGDELLREIARRLRSMIRPGDLVARLGGDEFVVVLTDVEDPDLPKDLAHRLRDQLRKPLLLGGELAVVDASIGVAWADEGHCTGVDVLRDADLAMYGAKQGGRARVEVFDPRMQESVGVRRDIERALRDAIASGHLQAHIQPIVDVATGEVVMGEVLARWWRDGVAVSPGIFIPIAEESNLIIELGRWVIQQACRHLVTWQAEGWEGRLSVNISSLHVTGGDLAGDVAAAVTATGADPTRLIIEITESVLVDDPEGAAERLHQVRRFGPEVVMDDFGTGYSSLTYLRRLPISGVKLDGSFVAGAGRSTSDDSIVRMVADLAAALDLWVVAEGVERPDQLEVIRAAGFTHAQGFLWSPAVRPEEFRALCDRPPTAAARPAATAS